MSDMLLKLTVCYVLLFVDCALIEGKTFFLHKSSNFKEPNSYYNRTIVIIQNITEIMVQNYS